MTKEQVKIKERRIMLQNQIQQAHSDIKTFRTQLREICSVCKHDDTIIHEQSASGNEYYNLCSICGQEM